MSANDASDEYARRLFAGFRLQIAPFHQPRKIFRLLIAELEHDLDLAICEHAHIRRILFGE
jgi:hypothetical protein